ncbi:hypothetical protein [Pseudoalteromonas sp. SaAl2]
MLANFEKLFSEFSTGLEMGDFEKLLKIDEEIKVLFKESIENGHLGGSEQLQLIADKHHALTVQVSELEKSTFEQLAQFQKNQKNLKKYQNV